MGLVRLQVKGAWVKMMFAEATAVRQRERLIAFIVPAI